MSAKVEKEIQIHNNPTRLHHLHQRLFPRGASNVLACILYDVYVNDFFITKNNSQENLLRIVDYLPFFFDYRFIKGTI